MRTQQEVMKKGGGEGLSGPILSVSEGQAPGLGLQADAGWCQGLASGAVHLDCPKYRLLTALHSRQGQGSNF